MTTFNVRLLFFFIKLYTCMPDSTLYISIIVEMGALAQAYVHNYP